MKRFPVELLLAACLAATPLLAPAAARTAHARIEALDLPAMLQRADGAVFGEIVDRHVFRVPEPAGPGLFFTRLEIDGVSMIDGRAIRVDVLHHGGFVDAEHGVHSSEAPPAQDTAVGTTVVAFYRWVDDLGGGVAGNALYASQGGLYRAVEGPLGPTVLGRGEGFAVANNLTLRSLTSAVRTLEASGR